MSTVILSYSLSGNNRALAASLAEALGGFHLDVVESKPRTTQTITFDILFNRIPSVQPEPKVLDQYDRVVFMGPVWMGKIATPLRPYLAYLKKHPIRYSFVSISGGADGDNPKLAGELFKRTGTKPEALQDLHITGLLPAEPRPDRSVTSAYQLTEKDVKKLTAQLLLAENGLA